MTATALVLGGTGVIGRAAVDRLVQDGWLVTVAARGIRPPPSGADPGCPRFVRVDLDCPGALDRVLGDGVDVLVYLPCYAVRDADLMLSAQDRVGSIITVSSVAVYVDERGLGHSETVGAEDYPRLPVPVHEDHATAIPDNATYAGLKAAIEQRLFDVARVPITVFRPCKVHGVGAGRPMEWYFLKRALDQRPYIIHSYLGRTILHQVSAGNLAELIRLAARRPVHGAFNAADDEPLDALGVARIVAGLAGHTPAEVLLPGPAPAQRVGVSSAPGATPWNVPHSTVLSMRKARSELGYAPVVRSEDTIAQVCEWLCEVTSGRDWRQVFPRLAQAGDIFDYAAETAFVRRLAGSA
jgi:nucleoside-diphosphate-sugar epimerase